MTKVEIAKLIAELVGIVFGVMLTRYIIPWMKVRTSNEKWLQVRTVAVDAVRAAEQTRKKNEDKAAYVREEIYAKLSQLMMDFSTSDIERIHEAAVNAVKYGKNYKRKEGE